MRRTTFIAVLLCSGALAFGQDAPKTQPNRLLVGKLLYVSPMAAGLDGWLMDDLRQWGKYQVTGNAEGVDLVLKAYTPEKEQEWETNKDGVPTPKKEGKHSPLSHRKGDLPAAAFAVIDWVTDEPLWRAEVVNRKQKSDEPDPPLGPKTQIFGRDLTPDQLAQRVATKLRQYVASLEKPQGK